MDSEQTQSNYISDYKQLIVWQKSFAVAKLTYKLSTQLPKSELYGIISQMQRAAISIPSNIAEGCARNNKGEFIQFLGIAAGSAAELETQLLLSKELFLNIDITQALSTLKEVQKMLQSLITKLRLK